MSHPTAWCTVCENCFDCGEPDSHFNTVSLRRNKQWICNECFKNSDLADLEYIEEPEPKKIELYEIELDIEEETFHTLAKLGLEMIKNDEHELFQYAARKILEESVTDENHLRQMIDRLYAEKSEKSEKSD